MPDPLQNPAFRPPGFGEKLREIFLGAQRPLACVQVEVTSHCFGGCLYCPHTTQKEHWHSRHMQDDVFASLWPLLKQSRRAHLQGWGEPMLHPRFFDFASFARRAGCQVSTTCCGHIMDEERAAKILDCGMDIIAFSLVGTDKQSNAPRKNVGFDDVCRSIKTLRKAIDESNITDKPEIHIAYLLLADRMEAVSRLPALMDELDVDMAVVSTLDYLALPDQQDLAFAPQEDAKIRKARAILEQAARSAESSGRLLHYALPGAEAVAHAGGCRENIAASLYVDAAGNVSPCVYLNVPGNDPQEYRKIFGNCLQRSPERIWNDENYREFRHNLINNLPDPVCLRCPKRYER